MEVKSLILEPQLDSISLFFPENFPKYQLPIMDFLNVDTAAIFKSSNLRAMAVLGTDAP